MNTKQNLHTHSTYCDGRDTPEQMIAAAIKKGFGSLGFSGHSYMDWSNSFSMSVDGTDRYIEHITRLKAEYKGKIDIFCGIECDMYSDIDTTPYDYAIGSFHYFKINGEYVGFDRKPDEVRELIDTHFNGDAEAFAKRYYKEICTLPDHGRFDIIGHFDLCAKHFETIGMPNVTSEKYLSYAFDAISALKGKIPFFEVNTGNISRGYRSVPYPTLDIIKEFRRQGFGAVISSDCHNSEFLDCSFDLAAQLLKEGGFKERYILTKNGFTSVSLED